MRYVILMCVFTLLFLSLQINVNAQSLSHEESRLEDALIVFEESMAEERLPPLLLKQAEAVIIMPTIVRLALGIGGNLGRGILLVRDGENGWSSPVFLTLGGGSAGLQVGINVSNVILLFMSKDSVANVLNGHFTLGADIGLTAGPVGASSEIATDFNSEIYAYSRSKGLYAGLALAGSIIKIDHDANANLYGRYLRPADIFIAGSNLTVSPSVSRLKQVLNHYSF
jgi:SH3 domain-containing YSC84-like protein 1